VFGVWGFGAEQNPAELAERGLAAPAIANLVHVFWCLVSGPFGIWGLRTLNPEHSTLNPEP